MVISYMVLSRFRQLKTLSDDPTPQWLMRQRAPTVCHWVRQVDDLSGISGEWLNESAQIPEAVKALLEICGDSYLPFLCANEQAIASDTDAVNLEINGLPFSQPSFRYQAKCYSRLKSLYRDLPVSARERIDAVLEQTDCLRWLQRE